jgi:RNA polymerase sigma factor (sigma-70 family)
VNGIRLPDSKFGRPAHVLPHVGSTGDLVVAAQGGDESAFARLVERYQDTAAAYAGAMLQDYDMAQDAAQDAFIDAHRLLSSLREPTAFPSWFRTIVFKHCDRYRRRQRRLVELSAGESAAESAARDAPTAHDRVESLEERELVHAAVARLPSPEREVVLLFYMADHSSASIAEFLDININTVKTRLYSARRKLRLLMDERLGRHFKGDRPSNDPRFIRRVIASALPLQVWSIDSFGTRVSAGATISVRTTDVPNTRMWLIEPSREFGKQDWSRTIRVMKSMNIPGLAGGATINDDVLEQVSRLDELTYLDLSGAEQVTDRGIRFLSRCAQLEHLDISGTSVTDDGLALLRSLPHLRVFECRHTSTVSDAGMEHLRDAVELERLNVMGTPTGDGTIAALRGKPELRELFLGNAVSDSGLAALSEIPLFQGWREQQWDMSLLSPQVRGTFLWLNLASPVSDRGLDSMRALQGLLGISLFGGRAGPFDDRASLATSAGLSALATLEHLVWLGCTSRLCDDDAMRRIAQFPNLRFLMCQDAVAGDAGFSAIAEAPRLEFIWGRHCANLGTSGFVQLSRLRNLRGLAVSCRNVGVEGLRHLSKFPRLSELMPIDVPDDGFRQIADCDQIEALYCMYCMSITDRAAEHIAGLPRLRTYQAWRTRASDQTLNALSAVTTLEHVRLSECTGVTDQGLLFLRRMPNLRIVDLERLPGVTMEGAALLPSHIRVNFMAG